MAWFIRLTSSASRFSRSAALMEQLQVPRRMLARCRSLTYLRSTRSINAERDPARRSTLARRSFDGLLFHTMIILLFGSPNPVASLANGGEDVLLSSGFSSRASCVVA